MAVVICHPTVWVRSFYLKILPTIPLAMFPASPVVEKAVPAMLDAWLNLSHREKAKELVTVRAIAIATNFTTRQYERHHPFWGRGWAPSAVPAHPYILASDRLQNLPTSGSQINMNRTSASTASAIHSSGWT